MRQFLGLTSSVNERCEVFHDPSQMMLFSVCIVNERVFAKHFITYDAQLEKDNDITKGDAK